MTINSLNNNLYFETKSADLHLVMERLTDDNLKFWSGFFKKIRKYAEVQCNSSDLTKRFMVTGYIAISESMVAHLFHPHDFWILFASAVGVSAENPHPEESIEMVCTVSTAEGAPFTTHQGITRTVNAVEGKLVQHKGLSVDLHRFGARVMRQLHPEKVYMVNAPMPKMEEIFIKALGKEHVHIGLDEDWIKEAESEDKERVEYFQNQIAFCGSDPIIRLGPGWSSFKLKDLQGKVIMDLNEEQMHKEHAWYFRRSSSLSNRNHIIAISLDILVGNK